MTDQLASIFATPEPADLGPGPRAGVKAESDVRSAVAALGRKGRNADLLLALALLWHDHHDPAHEICQVIENADGSYVHAILHRREPDYWNSKYWFRRVGAHPAYGELARQVAEFLKDAGQTSLLSKLIPGGRWDAMAFVDACETAAGEESENSQVLRSIQQIEFAVLAEYLGT